MHKISVQSIFVNVECGARRTDLVLDQSHGPDPLVRPEPAPPNYPGVKETD